MLGTAVMGGQALVDQGPRIEDRAVVPAERDFESVQGARRAQRRAVSDERLWPPTVPLRQGPRDQGVRRDPAEQVVAGERDAIDGVDQYQVRGRVAGTVMKVERPVAQLQAPAVLQP